MPPESALDAGAATWPQIAEAVGSGEEQVRKDTGNGPTASTACTWYEGKFGLNDADYTTAIQRAADPPARLETENEAGQCQHAIVWRPGRPAHHEARFQQASERKRLP